MAFIRRPNYWLCLAACAAAFWITLRVMAAPVAAAHPSLDPTADLAADPVGADVRELRDPALERMISRFAREATETRQRQSR
jgi:hypothetical protein